VIKLADASRRFARYARANYGTCALVVSAAGALGVNGFLAMTFIDESTTMQRLLAPTAKSASSADRFILLFQAADCPSGEGWIEQSNERLSQGRDVKGYVIVGAEQADPIAELVSRAGIGFPLGKLNKRVGWHFLNAFGYVHTPVALVVDSLGRLVALGAPSEMFRRDSANIRRAAAR